MLPRQHFVVLDGLRGVAAFSVVLYHYGAPLNNGFLAVDFFFLLSGFVISYSYQDRLLAKMTLRRFIAKRIIRLYPMVLAGCFAGLLVTAGRQYSHPEFVGDPIQTARLFGQSLLLIPNLGINQFTYESGGLEIFPLNSVLWSLFFEFVLNIVYAVTLRWLNTGILFILLILALAFTVLQPELGGNLTTNFWAGFPRATFGFFGGVVLHRLWSSGRLPRFRLGIFASSSMLVALFSIPVEVAGVWFIPTAALFFAIIVAGSNASTSRLTDQVSKVFGALSYPVYLLHMPLIYVFSSAARHVFPSAYDATLVNYGAVFLLALVALVSYLALIIYDQPVRKFLDERSSRRFASAAPQGG